MGMYKFNTKRNTLEVETYHYELQDVKQPNLFPEMFPYGEVPKIIFNHRIVPMNPPDNIWITDTTFRDGQQSRPPMSVKQIVHMFTLMHKLGGPKGVIRQAEFFLYSDKDRRALEKCLELGYEFPEITGWIRANSQDFKLVKEMGLRETGILTSASDYHIFLKMNLTRKQALDKYLGIVKDALAEGIIPRCHFEDITRADFYGFVVPFAQELMKLAKEAKTKIKIRACDTMGYGVTYPGVTLPRSVKGIIHGLNTLADVPCEWLEWHGHNDFYRSLNNATTAWLYGCSAANGTMLGIGERTGNTPLEALIIEYISMRGTTDGIDTTVITEIKEFFEKEIGYNIPANQPFVGDDFNVTRAGIHADGLSKNEQIYNIFDTNKILKRPAGVAITDKSGVAGIVHWINTKFQLSDSKKILKENEGVHKIKKWVDAQYQKERNTTISDDELFELVAEFIPELLELTNKEVSKKKFKRR